MNTPDKHILNKIKVEKDLEDLITPLNKEEFRQLQANILAEGCRDPLVVWSKGNKTLVLIDGHNRFRICQKHDISFSIKEVELENVEEVKLWMLTNQLGRRNLNPEQLSYYRGLKYLGLKRKHGGFDNVKSKGQNEPSTAEMLSQEFKISESTIKRDAKFAEGLEVIARSNPELRNDILVGDAKFKKNDIVTLTQTQDEKLTKFKNAADLHNKLNIIKNNIFEDLESRLENIENDKIKLAQTTLNETDPIFLDKEDRIRRIKGRIISVMNRAIQEKDVSAIGEMKDLIESLEFILLE